MLVREEGYVRLALSGVVGVQRGMNRADREVVLGATRVLVDYSAVVAITADAHSRTELALANERRGLRIAVYAPTPLTFAWNRQVIQLAGVRENQSTAVFKELQPAIDWLLRDEPGLPGSRLTG